MNYFCIFVYMKKITIFLLLFHPFITFGQSVGDVVKKIKNPLGIVNKIKPPGIVNKITPPGIVSKINTPGIVSKINTPGIVSKINPVISNRFFSEIIAPIEELDKEYQESNFKGDPNNTKYELPDRDAMTDHERYNYELKKLSKTKN